jgi:hypothetical protein
MATLLTINNVTGPAFNSAIKPQITSITVTNSAFNTPAGKTTVSANSTGYITIKGSNFTVGTQVYSKLIGMNANALLATSITYINSTQLNVQLQASNVGNALLYVINSYGTLGIKQITFA